MYIAMFIVVIVTIALFAKRINFLKAELHTSHVLLERVTSDLEYIKHQSMLSWYGSCLPACSYCAKEEREQEFEEQYGYIPMSTDTARLQREYERAYEELLYKEADPDLEQFLKEIEAEVEAELALEAEKLLDNEEPF